MSRYVNTTNRLQALREAAGWGQTDLAARLKPQPTGKLIHAGTIARWEAKGRIPDHRKAELADLFGVSISYLMGWSEYEGTP